MVRIRRSRVVFLSISLYVPYANKMPHYARMTFTPTSGMLSIMRAKKRFGEASILDVRVTNKGTSTVCTVNVQAKTSSICTLHPKVSYCTVRYYYSMTEVALLLRRKVDCKVRYCVYRDDTRTIQ
jgi:hypothetical protein